MSIHFSLIDLDRRRRQTGVSPGVYVPSVGKGEFERQGWQRRGRRCRRVREKGERERHEILREMILSHNFFASPRESRPWLLRQKEGRERGTHPYINLFPFAMIPFLGPDLADLGALHGNVPSKCRIPFTVVVGMALRA